METLVQKKRRLFGKANYQAIYLDELSRLLHKKVSADDLLSIVDTDSFIENTSFSKDTMCYKETINFDDKDKLKGILEKNVSDFDREYFMFIAYSYDCGLMKLHSLREFNLEFSLYDEHGGIIEFLRADGKERILLDYGEEFGKEYLEIEIYKLPESAIN